MSRKPSVLFVTADHPYAQFTGAFQYARSVLNLLREVSNVKIVSLDGNIPKDVNNEIGIVCLYPSKKMKGGVKMFDQLSSILLPGSMIERQFQVERCTKWVIEVFESHRPDLIIFNHLRSAWLVPHLAPTWQGRSVYLAQNPEGASYHSTSELEPNFMLRRLSSSMAKKIETLENAVLRNCMATWCISNEDRGRLSSNNNKPVLFVAPMVPRVALPERPAAQSMILVGSFNWRPKRRNALWLIEEVWPLVRKLAPQLDFHIIGIGAHRLRPHVPPGSEIRIFSDVDSVEPFLSRGGIFAVPERHVGGVKLKTLEAANWGLPIVSTPEGIEGTPLRDGLTCVVAQTPRDFAEAVARLAADSAKARELGLQAKVSVERVHLAAQVQRQFAQMFSKLCDIRARVTQ